MNKSILEVKNLSKKYKIGNRQSYYSLRDTLSFLVRSKLSKSPKKVSESSNDFWALKNVSFKVTPGEVVGIIGRNGAGKSTLLKILSRITPPTKGEIVLRGRVASLLEVGTGFHPELSGRENIFLNGSILGMTRKEVLEKFDAIVEFAEIEKFLDTPVKHYSSGMYMRLAFAVAAHLEPEILIVDEVLAVGDVEFQKKCLGKMENVAKTGRTVLFVSHNIEAIKRLCKTGILLDKGTIVKSGKIQDVIDEYLKTDSSEGAEFILNDPSDPSISAFAKKVVIQNLEGKPANNIPVGDPWQIAVDFEVKKEIKHFIIALGINSDLGFPIRTVWSNPRDLKPGHYKAVFKEKNLIQQQGRYGISIGLSSYERPIQYLQNCATLEISNVAGPNTKGILRISNVGLILNPMQIQISSL